MPSAGAAPRAAVPISSASAEASRKNGARSRGPKSEEGKARPAQNALKHGLRAAKHVVLPDEDPAEFAALEAALIAELAPQDTLQSILVGRIARAAWRLERAERIEVDLFTERLRRVADDGGVGLALIRDGNSTRSFETVLRYRGAAQTELLRSLKALQALQAAARAQVAGGAAAPARAAALVRLAAIGPASPASPGRRAACATSPNQPAAPEEKPGEPERGAGPRPDYVLPDRGAPGRTLHEPAAPWMPNEPETPQPAASAPARPDLAPNEPEPHGPRGPDGKTAPPPAPAPSGMRATDSQGRMDRLNKCRAHR